MIWEEFIRMPRIIHIDVLNKLTPAARGYTCSFEAHGPSYEKSEQVSTQEVLFTALANVANSQVLHLRSVFTRKS